jgi:hypothetical protein
MTKKIVWVRGGPEMKAYPIEVNVPKLKKTKDGVPESPPNFTPGQVAITSESGPVYSSADGYERAMEKKEI